jgi:hypothetical protein
LLAVFAGNGLDKSVWKNYCLKGSQVEFRTFMETSSCMTCHVRAFAGPSGRYVAFQMAEVAVPRTLFADILRLIAELRPPPVTSTA